MAAIILLSVNFRKQKKAIALLSILVAVLAIAVIPAFVIPTFSATTFSRIPTVGSQASAIGANYSKLARKLAAGNFQAADRETLTAMSWVWARLERTEPFPCKDLHTLDDLWQKYSNRRFGFSVQNSLWKKAGENSPGENSAENEWIGDLVSRFCDRLGWRSTCEVGYKDLTLSRSAPLGHLPTSVLSLGDEGYDPELELLFFGRNPGSYEFLASVLEEFYDRVETCQNRQ